MLQEKVNFKVSSSGTKKGKKGKGKSKAEKQCVALDRPLVAAVTDGPSSASEERFYLTTAINYTNGDPHLGHVYEAGKGL